MIKLIVLLILLLNHSLLSFLHPNKEAYAEGLVHFTNENYLQAIKSFQTALKLDPENPTVLNALASSYQKNSDFKKANRHYDEALLQLSEKDTRRTKLHFNQGNNFFRMEQFDQAIEQYKKALDLDDQDRSSKKNLEIALRKLQQQQSQQPSPQDQNQKNSRSDKKNKKNKNQSNQKESSKQDSSSQQKNKDQPDDQNSQEKNQKQNKSANRSSIEENSPRKQNQSGMAGKAEISLKQVEEILKAFSQKEIKNKGFQFYQEKKTDKNKKNTKNW